MEYRLFIGSYTRSAGHVPEPRGEGVSLLSWDPEIGVTLRVVVGTQMENPSWLQLHVEGRILYTITETADGPGELHAWRLFRPGGADADSALVSLGHVPGPGRAGCHLAMSPDSNLICAASYVDGAVVGYALEGDGGLGAELFRHDYTGRGPNLERQQSSHAHQVVFDPKGRWFYVIDLGADRIWKHPSATPEAKPDIALICPPGSGPRHMVFGPDGDTAHVVCELKPRIITVKIDPDTGTMRTVSDDTTVPPARAGAAHPSAIKIHPSGKSLIVANRFDDSITVFGLEGAIPGDSMTFPCRGRTPRDATFSTDGRWLVIANQDSHSIQCCGFESDSGAPSGSWGVPIDIGSPSCIVMSG